MRICEKREIIESVNFGRNFSSSQKRQHGIFYHHTKVKRIFTHHHKKRQSSLYYSFLITTRLAKASCEPCSYNKAQNQRF